MDALLLGVTFFFGLIAQQLRLPPLVGFLISGFVLQSFGQEGGEAIGKIAELGVTLMLFTIGVKLRLRTLALAMFLSLTKALLCPQAKLERRPAQAIGQGIQVVNFLHLAKLADSAFR